MHQNIIGTVNIDTTLLRHIVSNLLTNAVKYSPPGGKSSAADGYRPPGQDRDTG
ncbi:MAG: ATP-binding protein [Bacteroidales bacterium]|nr:ATP-binding protein [Bacteroidales bacterium]